MNTALYVCVLQTADGTYRSTQWKSAHDGFNTISLIDCGARESLARLAMNRESWRPRTGGFVLERAEAGARATGPQAPGLSRFGPKVPRNFGGSKGLPNLAEKSSNVEEFGTEFGSGFRPERPGHPYLYPSIGSVPGNSPALPCPRRQRF